MTEEMKVSIGDMCDFISKKEVDGSQCMICVEYDYHCLTPQEAKALIRVLQHYLSEE